MKFFRRTITLLSFLLAWRFFCRRRADLNESSSGYKWEKLYGSVNLKQTVDNTAEEIGSRWGRR